MPHIDAALIVLGADPPIIGEELAPQVDELIFVVDKADRTSDRERAEAVRFTERILSEQLRRPIGHMFEVSALERLQGGPPRRGGPVGARRWPGDRASIS